MKKLLTIYSLFILSCALNEGCRQRVLLPVDILEVTPLLELTSLIPKYEIIPLFYQDTAIDKRDILYFIDHRNHRILKFNLRAELIDEIGGIGQDANSLFNPIAIAIANDSLYILNNGGTQLKIFDLDGHFISAFLIDNSWTCHSLFIDGDSIYINVIDKSRKSMNDSKLISIYNHKGILINKIGPIIECNSFVGYRHFNSIRMQVSNNMVYYAFTSQPYISWCNGDGKHTTFIDLRKYNIPEINGIIKRTKISNYDTPETIKDDTDLGLTIMRFCYGFVVDEAEGFYYVINMFDSTSTNNMGSSVLYFNKKKELARRILFRAEGEPVVTRNLLVSYKRAPYGIGTIKGRTFLFNF